MQAFFYSTYRRLGDSGFLKEYKSEVVDEVPGHLQIFYNEKHMSLIENKREFLANCGVFVWENKFNRNALEEILLSKSRHLEWYIERCETHGQFFLLDYEWNKDRTKKEFKLIVDQFATIPIYVKYCNDSNYEISNVYQWLIDAKVGEVNLFALDQRLSIDWNYPLFTNETLFENIKLAEPSSIYHLEKEQIRKENYKKENRTILDEAIENNYKFLDDIDRIWCDVTGGFDTRLNLDQCLKRFILTYENKDKVLFGNDLSKEDKWLLNGKYSDHNICKQIEKKYNIKIKDYTKYKEGNFVDVDGVLKFNDSPVMSNKRCLHHKDVATKADIKLTGFAGTELCTNPSIDLYRGGTWDNYIIGRQKHRDLLKKGKWYSYYLQIDQYLHTNIKRWSGSEQVFFCYDFYNNDIWLTAFQNCQQSYWGVANLFMPVYSPYMDLLSILLKKTREDKEKYRLQRNYYDEYMLKGLSNIPTTHGFPACNITWKNWHRFIRLFIRFSDYNLQYINVWRRLRRYTIDKLFYHFPTSKLLKYVGEKLGKNMAFMNRKLLIGGLDKFVDRDKFKKIKIDRQPLLWIYKLDKIMYDYLKKKET